VPTGQLTPEQLKMVFYGTGDKIYSVPLGSGRSFDTTFEGVIPNLERRHKETESDFIRRDIERFMQELPCNACQGRRLKPEILAVTVANLSIMDICELSIDDAAELFKSLKLNPTETTIAKQILKKSALG
jgi:excinuclease ABC subunit A